MIVDCEMSSYKRHFVINVQSALPECYMSVLLWYALSLWLP